MLSNVNLIKWCCVNCILPVSACPTLSKSSYTVTQLYWLVIQINWHIQSSYYNSTPTEILNIWLTLVFTHWYISHTTRAIGNHALMYWRVTIATIAIGLHCRIFGDNLPPTCFKEPFSMHHHKEIIITPNLMHGIKCKKQMTNLYWNN